MAFSERELLARLIQCEAGGEGETGMLAVAGVVMNRVNITYGEYGRTNNNIRETIFQPGQFECATEQLNGRYNPQNIYNMSPEQIHYDIADLAISGSRVADAGFALWFYNPYSAGCRSYFPGNSGRLAVQLGNHCFYEPTEAYAYT